MATDIPVPAHSYSLTIALADKPVLHSDAADKLAALTIAEGVPKRTLEASVSLPDLGLLGLPPPRGGSQVGVLDQDHR